MVAMNRGWIRKDPLSFRFDPSVNSVTLCIFDDFFDVQPLVKPFKVIKFYLTTQLVHITLLYT